MSELKLTYNTAETAAESPLGVLRVWATSREHVGISTGDGAGVASVTINRVPFRVRMDFHPESYYTRQSESGGRVEWQSQPNTDELAAYGWSSGRGHNPITRTEWDNVRDMHGSYAAQEKARAILTEWVAEWLAADDGHALLEAGQRVHDKRERESLTARRAELEAELGTIAARLEVLGDA